MITSNVVWRPQDGAKRSEKSLLDVVQCDMSNNYCETNKEG